MSYNYNDRFLPQMPPAINKEASEFQCYVPDYSAQNQFYSVDGQPINLIDNAQHDTLLQNIAQQQLVDVSSSSFPTTGLSDREIAETALPRYAEISDLEDSASANLAAFDKLKKELNKS